MLTRSCPAKAMLICQVLVRYVVQENMHDPWLLAKSASCAPTFELCHASQQSDSFQVQELEEKLAALSQDFTAQRSAVEAAQQSAGEAAQERISVLQTRVEETLIERDQMQTDVHSLQLELHDQDRRYREVCSSSLHLDAICGRVHNYVVMCDVGGVPDE